MTVTKSVLSGCIGALAGLAMLSLGGQAASAQTYGLATMQPGTLAHTVASAIAKTLKEKGGLNTLVQNTAGESVLIPMVAKGEIDLGMANMLEVVEGIETGKLQNDLRIIGSIYVLRMGFFTRKDSGIVNMADVKGKRVPAGYSAMRTLDKNTLAMLATADLTLNDVKPVMVPNVLRGGDDFMAGANDMFMFSFGGPKVREADATVGGLRVLDMDEKGMPAARKIMKWGYAIPVQAVRNGAVHAFSRTNPDFAAKIWPGHPDGEVARSVLYRSAHVPYRPGLQSRSK